MSDKTQIKQRLSNMELARIIAMLMIVIGHFLLEYGLWNGSSFIDRTDISNPVTSCIYVILYGFCVIGANVFILISGYFSIHLSWRSFLSYCFLCVFYNALVFIINLLVFDLFSWKALIKVFLVDKTVNWFFRAYFWLMLLSPLLNKAIESASISEMRIIIMLLLFLNCVSGFLFQEYNLNGYNVYNFIFLYVLGGWIKKDYLMRSMSKSVALSAYGAFCIINSLIAIAVLFGSTRSIQQIFAYNNPLVIFASISFFVAFTKFSFTSKFINVFASTVVATLFIQHIFIMLMPVFPTISPMSAFLFITPLLFVIAFVIEWPRGTIANQLIARILKPFMKSSC